MNTVNLIEDNLPGFRGQACLVQNEETEEFFVISTVTPHSSEYDGDFETLAFRADADGSIIDWMEVAGGRNMSTADVIGCLVDGDLFSYEAPTFDRSMFLDDEWDDAFSDNDLY